MRSGRGGVRRERTDRERVEMWVERVETGVGGEGERGPVGIDRKERGSGRNERETKTRVGEGF